MNATAKSDDKVLIRGICRYVAREYRDTGIDPKMVSGKDAWTWYVMRTEGYKRAHGEWHSTPQEYKDFLQVDGPGGIAFVAEWEQMTRAELIEAADLWIPKGLN